MPGRLVPVFCPEAEAKEINVDPGSLPGWCAEEIPLFCGSIKKGLLALLQSEGVIVLFMTHVSAVLMQDMTVSGVLLANKHGIQALHARTVVDATADGSVATLAGVPRPMANNVRRRYTIGFTGTAIPATPELDIAQSIDVHGGTVRIHPGKNRSCNTYVEFAFDAEPVHGDILVARTAVEQQARRLGMEVAAYLIGNVPEFAQGTVAEFAPETATDVPSEISSPVCLPAGLLGCTVSHAMPPQGEEWGRLRTVSAKLVAEAISAARTAPAIDPDHTAICFGDVRIPVSACRLSAFDDPGLASSQNEQDTRRYAVAAGVPLLEPSDSQEAYEFTRLAFELSERWKIPVILKLTTRVCHSGTIVTPRPPDTGLATAHFERNIDLVYSVVQPFSALIKQTLNKKLSKFLIMP